MIRRKFFLLAAAGLTLAACQNAPVNAALKPGICDPAAVETLSGKPRISDGQAKRLTGATIVRQIKPGQPVTMDYRQERVTVVTDPETGKVVRAICG